MYLRNQTHRFPSPMSFSSFDMSLRTGLVAAAVGAAAGFVVGVLVAPEEGRKLRQRAAYQLEHVGGQVGTLLEQLRASQDASVRHARRSGNAVVADAEEKAQRIREDIDALLNDLQRHSAP